MLEDAAGSWQVVGPLSGRFIVTETDQGPRLRRVGQREHARAAAHDVNARLILHRTALIAAGPHAGAEGPHFDLDDKPIRAWAVESGLGQDRRDDLRASVAARHARALESLAAATGATVLCVDIEPQAAMVTGTGAGGIRNVGIELHGTHGWPVIPASTLKGAAAAHARDTAATPDVVRIFGAPRPGDDAGGQDHDASDVPDGDEAADVPGGKAEPVAAPGSVRFFDALPGPDGVTVAEHVLTPHARDYHTGPATADDQRSAPAEYLNPVPIPFLAIEGGRFTVHLLGPEADVRSAARLLADAVDDLGVGAKTSAGYGYFDAVIRPVPTAAQR
jgi:CRISPR type III-B/RAMP module RAMP protein Cmr6